MPTKHPDLFAALAAPFDPAEVKVRTQAGRQLHYVTARTVMNRLDNVLGPEGWWDDYTPGEHSVVCRLTLRLPDGSTLTKADAGGYAGMSDQGDDDKSGYSDAFKRAAVKFGVARYLYRDGVPHFVGDAQEAPSPPVPAANGKPRHGWPGASSPAIARPSPSPSEPEASATAHPSSPPRTGRALFAWVRSQEQTHGVGLLKLLNTWGKLQGYPGRIVDWSPDQVAAAHAEASRNIESLEPATAE